MTPIDLCGAKPFPLPAGAPKPVGTNYDVARKVNIFNNGHTIQNMHEMLVEGCAVAVLIESM